MTDTNQHRVIEILVETDSTYAHIDQAQDCLVVTYQADVPGEEILRLITMAMDHGFWWMRHTYHDADLDREVAIFYREREAS